MALEEFVEGFEKKSGFKGFLIKTRLSFNNVSQVKITTLFYQPTVQKFNKFHKHIYPVSKALQYWTVG